MQHISKDDREYGLRRLERKVARLKRKLSSLEAKENLSCWGWESVGRLKEAIDIYKDMIDLWETEDDTNEKNVTFDNTNDLLVQFAMLWGMEIGSATAGEAQRVKEMKCWASDELANLFASWIKEYLEQDEIEDSVDFFQKQLNESQIKESY